MTNKTKITVVGSGYVGMSLAVLLAQCNDVVVLDVDVSNVENMRLMFWGNISFNRDLSSWDVSNVTNCGALNSNSNSWILPKPNFTNCSPD